MSHNLRGDNEDIWNSLARVASTVEDLAKTLLEIKIHVEALRKDFYNGVAGESLRTRVNVAEEKLNGLLMALRAVETRRWQGWAALITGMMGLVTALLLLALQRVR